MNLCRWPEVVLLGDSLTERSFEDGQWGAILQDKLQRRCDVVNRGHGSHGGQGGQRGQGGYNSTWLKFILPDIINSEILKDVEVVSMVIFIGANDCTSPWADLHVPIETYKQNLQEIVVYLKSINLQHGRIILVTPPPVNESVISTCCRGNLKTDMLAEEYSEVCCNVAMDTGVAYLDIYHAIKEQANWTSLMHDDGVHLSIAGAQFLERQLWPIIEKQVEDCAVMFPAWQDFESSPRVLVSPKMIKQLTIEESEDFRQS